MLKVDVAGALRRFRGALAAARWQAVMRLISRCMLSSYLRVTKHSPSAHMAYRRRPRGAQIATWGLYADCSVACLVAAHTPNRDQHPERHSASVANRSVVLLQHRTAREAAVQLGGPVRSGGSKVQSSVWTERDVHRLDK